MSDTLLAQIKSRFETYARGGREDHSLVMSDDAEDEVEQLWHDAVSESSDGNPSLIVLEAIAWLHWARYYAKPAGADRDDAQAASVLFAPVYLIDHDRVPKELSEFLAKGDVGSLPDNAGTPASAQSAYVEQRYPGAAAHAMYLQYRLRNVPMPSIAKPDINGFREGDRVRLIKPFNGQRNHFDVGKVGTILVTNTAPAHIEVARDMHMLEIYMDDRALISMKDSEVEKIPGRVGVTYSDDGESFTINYG